MGMKNRRQYGSAARDASAIDARCVDSFTIFGLFARIGGRNEARLGHLRDRAQSCPSQMSAFFKQFDQQDPFAVALSAANQEWARWVVDEAATMLQGHTPQELTLWARALETQLQEIAAMVKAANAKFTVEAVRWQVTDLELTKVVDLGRLRKEVMPPDDPIDSEPSLRHWRASERPVQRWHLFATLALWKIIDAHQVRRRASNAATSDGSGAIRHYSGAKLPRWLDHAAAAELENSLVKEATAAAVMASAALRQGFLETDAPWAMEALRQKKIDDSSKGGRATQADTYLAREFVRDWLANLPLDVCFKDRTAAADEALCQLSMSGFDFKFDAVFMWLATFHVEEPELVRWPLKPQQPDKSRKLEIPLVRQHWTSSIIPSSH